MPSFQLWAQPWWVNLLLLIPLATYFAYRRKGSNLHWRQLIIIAIFAVAFGFVEAAVVVYLRAAIGLLPGYMGTFADLRHSSLGYTQAESLTQFPQSLLTIEMYREAATMVMLMGVALLSASKASARWAAFLWVFALWDMAYYAGLWITVRWPASLTDFDVLLDSAGVVPVAGKPFDSGCGCVIERRISAGNCGRRQSCRYWLLITLHYGHLAGAAVLLHSRLWGKPSKSSQPTE